MNKRKKIEKVKKLASANEQNFTEAELAFLELHNIVPENKFGMIIDPTASDEKMVKELKKKLPEDMIIIYMESANK